MLLGRTANGLYWMNRYIERAENMARLVDAGLRMALTRTQSASEEWNSVLLSAGSDVAFKQKYSDYTAADVADFLCATPRTRRARCRRSRRLATMPAWCAPR